MNITTQRLLSVLITLVFMGCGDSSDITESNTSSAEELPVSSISYLTKRMSRDDANSIKPLQIITNMQELNALYEALQLERKFDEEIDFTKDVVIVIKRLTNLSSAGLNFGNDGNKTIRLESHIFEIGMVEEEANASINVGLVTNAFDKPIFLTKRTTLIDKETSELRKVTFSYATSTSGKVENIAYLTSGSHLNHVIPSLVTSIDSLEEYAIAYDFNMSQLRFNNEQFDEGRIISSGYYVSSDKEASYDTPKLRTIHDADYVLITAENNTSEWIPNHYYVFEINGVQQDCNETYPNKKEALFYKIDAPQEVIYHAAEQKINLKSCSNIRTADLEELGEWISKRTWQAQ